MVVVWIVTCGRLTKPPSLSAFSILAWAAEAVMLPIAIAPINGMLTEPVSEMRDSMLRSGF